MSRSSELFARASSVIPGGVNSPVRAFGSVGGTPRFMVSASGPYITDADGVRYTDLVNSWGPGILGHAHPAVVDAVQRAASRGLSFGASTPAETELAEAIISRVRTGAGSSPLERVRLVSTGTEATMTAIRLARGFTGRDLLVKFAGHYHGHSDSLLAEAGSGLATLAMPGSAGVTAATAAQTLVLPYNDPDALHAAFTEHGERIAAVITEAAAANMGVVPPDAGFNALVASVAHQHGALMILDEVLTGFRVGPGGWWAEENAGEAQYLPDLFTFGKVIGGGMPLAAVAGSARVMDRLAPLGPVYQAGTLSGNPVAVAAGLATLEHADARVYTRMNELAVILAEATSTALSEAAVPHSVQTAGNLFSFAFGAEFVDSPPRDYAAIRRQESVRYSAFFHSMLDSGVLLPPSAFEAWFVSAAIDEEALERILSALPRAASSAGSVSPAD